jgi:hypothetical protein
MATLHGTTEGPRQMPCLLVITPEPGEMVRFVASHAEHAGRAFWHAIMEAEDLRLALADGPAADVAVPALYGKRLDFLPRGERVVVHVAGTPPVVAVGVSVSAEDLRAALAEVWA